MKKEKVLRHSFKIFTFGVTLKYSFCFQKVIYSIQLQWIPHVSYNLIECYQHLKTNLFKKYSCFNFRIDCSKLVQVDLCSKRDDITKVSTQDLSHIVGSSVKRKVGYTAVLTTSYVDVCTLSSLGKNTIKDTV